ncbi:uncharacterized protein LOC142628646 [Castanea sativa]|uniref:uncharacterized protein LOC142628646 n=1 Tax=Castanea sativa TaxID=21020 RepID=UPI003F64C722
MVFDYVGGWNMHLLDTLWAYRSSTKTATGFLPFSSVYGTKIISPVELMVPTSRTLQGQELEMDAYMCNEAHRVDLETMDGTRDIAHKRNVHERIFVEGQLVLRATDYVRRNIAAPSKFAPYWESPYIVKEAHGNGYYLLYSIDESAMTNPINGRWLKLYHS